MSFDLDALEKRIEFTTAELHTYTKLLNNLKSAVSKRKAIDNSLFYEKFGTAQEKQRDIEKAELEIQNCLINCELSASYFKKIVN